MVVVAVVVLWAEVLMSADFFKGARWWGAMAWNQRDWAGLQEVCSMSLDVDSVSAYKLLGYK